MNILIVDQCSKAKSYEENENMYTIRDIDSHSLAELRDRSRTPAVKARRLYTGRQQQYINRAVDVLREVGDTVDRLFISAGFGLIDENDILPPYDVTFSAYSRKDIRERADHLDIQSDLMDILERDYDLIFLALGQEYYATFDLDTILEHIDSGTWIVCFNHDSETAELGNAVSLPARTREAEKLGTITVALKGRYLQNFADHRSQGRKIETAKDIEESCMTPVTEQSDLENSNF